MAEQHVMDGYIPGRAQHPLPQVQRRLVVRVEQVLTFSKGPHSDEPATA